ncbi:MAG TPA: hypothetical protein VLC09_05195 [Polyangiaceae bacterium]|nr:hypothetical protein [Polyangiaceae bacterium]
MSCTPPPASDVPLEPKPSARRPTQHDETTGAAGIISTLVGTLDEGSFGPHLSLGTNSRVVVWAAPAGETPGLYTLAVPYDSAPGSAQKLAVSIEGLRTLETFTLPGDATLVLLVRRSGSRDLLEALELDGAGALRAGPLLLAETAAELSWMDVRARAGQARIFWAETGRGSAQLFSLVLPLISGGAPAAAAAPKQPEKLVQGVSAWQLAGSREPLLVTLEGTLASRSVVLRRVPFEGTPRSTILKQGFRGGLDLDMASTAQRTVIALGVQSEHETTLERAVVDDEAKVLVPFSRWSAPRGEQALVRVVAGVAGEDAWLVWDEPSRRPPTGRELLLSRVPRDGALASPEATLETSRDPLLPIFAVQPTGLLAITRARRCAPGSACADARVEPILVRATPDVAGVEASPLEIAQLTRQPAAYVWDAQCNARGCFALGANGAHSPLVCLLDLRGEGRVDSPLVASRAALRPRVVSEETLDELPELVALRGAVQPNGTLLSWVSYFDSSAPEKKVSKPAPDGKLAEVRALLETELIDDRSSPSRLVQETVVSYRARSLGGVGQAVSAAPAGASEAAGSAPGRPTLLGWSALDGGKPQLFVTLVDEQGKKVKQRTLPRPGGEVTDVTVMALARGFLVAWVDDRSGHGEIYAAQLDERLELVGREQRLTEGAEQPTGLRTIRLADRTVLLWADARGASRPGFADVHWLTLEPDSAAPLGTVRRIAPSELHSHSPELVVKSRADGGSETALLAWMESDPTSDVGPSALHLATVDPVGNFVVPPRVMDLPGRVRGFTVDCSSEPCHLVAALDRDGHGELWGMAVVESPTPTQLFVSRGPSSETVAPLLLGRSLYFVDPKSADSYALRRLGLEF